MKNTEEIKDFSFDGVNAFYKEEKLKLHKNSQGYIYVTINKKRVRLHRLIAKKYIKNEFGLPCVDHLDGNKENNNINNLEWVSYSVNSKRAFNMNENMSRFHKKGYNKIIVSEKNNEIKEHTSVRACAKYINRNHAGVFRVLQGEWNLCNGYKLYYK